MTSIANLLKTEMGRVASRQARAEVQGIRQTVAPYRGEIASLKRRVQSLESLVRRLSRLQSKEQRPTQSPPDAPKIRFSAKGFAAQRKRLDLSARECGLLIGVSDQSIYKWEEGSAHPRAAALEKIAALRTLSKAGARKLVAALT